MRSAALVVVLGLIATGCSETVLLSASGEPVFDENGDDVGTGGPIRLRGAPECGSDQVAVIEIDYPLGNLDQGESRTYVRDPEAVLPPQIFEAPFDARSSLSRDARFTGYEASVFTIWLGEDADLYIYLVNGSRVEAWPQVLDFSC